MNQKLTGFETFETEKSKIKKTLSEGMKNPIKDYLIKREKRKTEEIIDTFIENHLKTSGYKDGKFYDERNQTKKQ